MAFFPTNTGGLFEGMNIFGARQPTYLEGLLSPEELQKVQNQAMLQGVLGTAATYLAQPKNQGYGSVLPYLGKAYLGGMQQSQGAYDTATQNLLTQGKLAEMKREAEAAKITTAAQQELLNDPRVQNNPTLKALAAKGDFSKLSDIISPKPAENDYDRYSFAYKEKPFAQLTAPEKQEIIKQVQADKKEQATQISFNQPVTAINPKTGKAELVQFPNKPGGQPIFTGLEKPESEVKLRPVPPASANAYIQNQGTLKKIDEAIAQVTKTPDKSFGAYNFVGDVAMQRLDPEGVKARAAVASVGGQKFHDLSGAAISVSEANRLKPYIPASTDTKENILTKLNNLKAEYESTNDTISNTFSEQQGYKPLNIGKTPAKETQLSPQDKQALDWANANPTDPRAVQIKQKLGL